MSKTVKLYNKSDQSYSFNICFDSDLKDMYSSKKECKANKELYDCDSFHCYKNGVYIKTINIDNNFNGSFKEFENYDIIEYHNSDNITVYLKNYCDSNISKFMNQYLLENDLIDVITSTSNFYLKYDNSDYTYSLRSVNIYKRNSFDKNDKFFYESENKGFDIFMGSEMNEYTMIDNDLSYLSKNFKTIIIYNGSEIDVYSDSDIETIKNYLLNIGCYCELTNMECNMDKKQFKATKSELKEIFPACKEIWELKFEGYVVVNIHNNYITIDDMNGQLIYESGDY